MAIPPFSPPPSKSRTAAITVGTVGMLADKICDGVTDDVQIQAAIDELGTIGGGSICIRAGIYTIADTIRVKDNIHIFGEGSKTIITIPSGVDVNAFENYNTTSGNENIMISDLAIDGTISGAHIDEIAGINWLRVTNSIVARCHIYDIFGFGIWVNEATDHSGESDHSIISNNIVTNCQHHNITIDSGSGTISNNICDTTVVYDNIQVDSIEDVTIMGNVCRNAGRHNIQVHSNGGTTLAAIENTVTGNICRGAGGSNIVFTADGAGEYSPRNIASSNQCHDATSDAIRIVRAPSSIVIGNMTRNSGRYGIWVNESIETNVTGNNSSDHTGLSGRGIYIDGSDNCTVSGNECNRNTQQGIELNLSEKCTVVGNSMTDNVNINMRLQDSDYNIVTGNQSSGERIQINNSSHNTLVANQSNDGIYGFQEVGTSDFNVITSNTAQNNSSASYAIIGTNDEFGFNIGQ